MLGTYTGEGIFDAFQFIAVILTEPSSVGPESSEIFAFWHGKMCQWLYILPAPDLDSAISPRSPGCFYWIMVFSTQSLGAMVLTVSFLRGQTSGKLYFKRKIYHEFLLVLLIQNYRFLLKFFDFSTLIFFLLCYQSCLLALQLNNSFALFHSPHTSLSMTTPLYHQLYHHWKQSKIILKFFLSLGNIPLGMYSVQK